MRLARPSACWCWVRPTPAASTTAWAPPTWRRSAKWLAPRSTACATERKPPPAGRAMTTRQPDATADEAAPPRDPLVARYLDWLAGSRKLADHTLTSYGRDLT